jgi:hypothetical protein
MAGYRVVPWVWDRVGPWLWGSRRSAVVGIGWFRGRGIGWFRGRGIASPAAMDFLTNQPIGVQFSVCYMHTMEYATKQFREW